MLFADDLILGTPALQEMVDAYQDGNMVAVMEVSPERPVPGITPDHENGPLITVKGLIEKPAPEGTIKPSCCRPLYY